MREMQKKEIDGIEYGMYEMSPFKTAPILSKLIKLLGGPLSKVIGSLDKKEGQSVLEADIKQDMLGDAVNEFAARMDDKEIVKLIQDLLPNDLITYMNEDMEKAKKITNTKLYFDKVSLMHLLKVVKFSLEVNFGDFLEGLGELKE